MFIFVSVAMTVYIIMISRAVNSKTAIISLIALAGIMSVVMTLGIVSMVGGIAFTVVAALVVLILDHAGILS